MKNQVQKLATRNGLIFGLLLVFGGMFLQGCPSKSAPTAAPAPVTVYYVPATATSTPTFPPGTLTSTPTPTLTGTPTSTGIPTGTFTPVAPVTIYYVPATGTNTYSLTSTNSPTVTLSPTQTSTSNPSLTPTPTFTRGEHSPTATYITDSPTFTDTPTITATPFSYQWNLVSTLGQYGPNGTSGNFDLPWSVAVSSGLIAISDAGYNNVQVFNSTGTWLYTIPLSSVSPHGIAIDSYGELYICDPYASHEVVGYNLTPSGFNYDYTWNAQGELEYPYGVSIDQNGNLVVSDYSGEVYNLSWSDDSILNETTSVPGTFDLYDATSNTNGNLYAAGFIINGSNYFYGVFGFNDYSYTSNFNGSSWSTPLGPTFGIVADSTGNLYISDMDNNRVVYATPQGIELGEIDGAKESLGVALDNAGDLFVVSPYYCNVSEYSK